MTEKETVYNVSVNRTSSSHAVQRQLVGGVCSIGIAKAVSHDSGGLSSLHRNGAEGSGVVKESR